MFIITLSIVSLLYNIIHERPLSTTKMFKSTYSVWIDNVAKAVVKYPNAMVN